MTTIREFRANLKTYLARIKAGEIIEVGDISLCVHGERATEGRRVHLGQDTLKEIAEELKAPMYTASWHCEKCKQPVECRKMYEEGVEHVICLVCALKAKLPWHKLEKL